MMLLQGRIVASAAAAVEESWPLISWIESLILGIVGRVLDIRPSLQHRIPGNGGSVM